MSRRSVEHQRKVNQMIRKGLTNFGDLIPDRVVKGKGKRGGWRVTEKGLVRFPAVDTGKICTQPAKKSE